MNKSIITPIKTKVLEKYLYDMDESKTGLIKCKVIGVSAYIGVSLTLHILLDDGSVFSNIPIFALRNNEITSQIVGNSELAFCNCPDDMIDVFEIEHFKTLKPSCRFNKSSIWVKECTYHFTVDFYEDNELLHFMSLNNGEMAWLPNHKINWFGSTELKPYKKMRKNWTI